MDKLLNTLFPKAACADKPPAPEQSEDPYVPLMDEEIMMGGGSDHFREAIDFKHLSNRRSIFQATACTDKIDGFKFSITTPVSPGFMVQNKWQLHPPQSAKNQNPMMAMMPQKSSHYELDLYYIHGLPEDQAEMVPGKFDHTKLTHFKGSVKEGGLVEAMIMKKVASWLDVRFEGQFVNALQSQWNLNFTIPRTLLLTRTPDGELLLLWKHELWV